MVHPVLWLRRRFVTGFFVTVPLIVSVVALVWVFRLIDSLTAPAYARLLGRQVPGLGLVTTIAFVLLVGVVASNVLGKRVLQQMERLLLLVPVFRTVYSPVKQMVVAFAPENEAGLKRVVMVEDSCGSLRLGFVTREFEMAVGDDARKLVAVYVPTNHLYLGDVYMYHPDAVITPDLSVEEGVRIILTGGMSTPERVRAGRAAADGAASGR
ncbi:MAG: DUF502 domain-containing protein [Acidobacteria bacterium]|nr:MAG: DUF502 domain-containing protein [Acidobacteriota bacterium]